MKKTVCIILALAAMICMSVACRPDKEASDSATEALLEASADKGVTRILLLGCDRTAELTDSILLVTVNETVGSTRILQIPRDTYAEYTDRSYKKINGAMHALGAGELKHFLEGVLGVSIDAYVALKPDALVSVVDAIGGVDVTVPQDMEYSDPAQGLEIHLKAGQRHLNGREAEQFVRYRSGYANADLGRMDAQKLFLQAFANRCAGLSFAQTLGIVMRVMTTVQTDIPLPTAIRLIGALRTCGAEVLPMETLPGLALQGESGAWYYAVNRAGAVRAVNEYLMPRVQVTAQTFDPQHKLDRESNERFHTVYEAPEDRLPYLASGI